jgi:eukaryotic-like serine/threonine-protein kinase
MIGRTIGHYVVSERIGAGAMGEVYRAHDTRLDRDVALKVVSTDPSSPEAYSQLRKEARALSRLNHPNIATVHDFDSIDGVTFVTMELVPGMDVRERVAAGAMPEADVLRLGAQAADALQAAHAAGVVHRDLKPANMRITPDHRLKVLDFGLAARTLTHGDAMHAETETMSVRIAGTLPYMAPEQLRGEPADPRSDIYALAVVLFELVTARRPFDARPDAVLIDQILNAPPPSPRSASSPISFGLEAIILKGLEKNPDRRYQSAREMLIDLERLRTPSSTAAAAGYPPGRVSRRIKWATVAAAAILTIALGGWGWLSSVNTAVLSFAPRDWIVVSDFENQTGDSVFDTSLATAFAVGLGQSTHANLLPRVRIDQALKRMGQANTARIDRTIGREIAMRESVKGLIVPAINRVGDQYVLSAELIDPQTATIVRSYTGRAADASTILEALGTIAQSVRRDLGESLASIRTQNRPLPHVTTASLEALQQQADGSAQWRRGRYNEALVHWRNAVRIDQDFAMAHAALGIAYVSFVFNDDKLGRQHFEKALSLADRTTQRERMFISAAYANSFGDKSHAVTLYRALLQSYPDYYDARLNLGNLLRSLRRYDEAAAEYEQVIRLVPGHAGSLINLATTFSVSNRVAEALDAYERAFAVEPGWRSSGNLNHEYGVTLIRAGRPEEASKVFALTLGSPQERPRGLRSQALLDMRQGKYRDAEARLVEAARLNDALKRTLSTGRDLGFAALVREGLGDRRGALEYFNRAVAEYEKVPSTAYLARVGVFYARIGDQQRAQRLWKLAQQHASDATESVPYDVRLLEGELMLAQGQPDRAIEILLKADAELDASPVLTKESLGYAYDRSGRIDLAIETYEQIPAHQAVGWEPQHAWFDAQYRLAQLYVKRGERDKAAARLDRLLQLWVDADPALPLFVAARRLRNSL